jgi:SAM-dependent methyltransferase
MRFFKTLYLKIGIHTAAPGTLLFAIHHRLYALYCTIAKPAGMRSMPRETIEAARHLEDILHRSDPKVRIDLLRSDSLGGEPARLFDDRLEEGFWGKFVRPGPVVDVGYKGAGSTPVFRDAIGLDLDTPGYDGKHMPFPDGSIGSIHASHVLEHISDYGFFLRECFRVLAERGTLMIFVPLMDVYERRATPPSAWNDDHKRFYTASRLLFEIESTVPRPLYRVIHVRERFRFSDLSMPVDIHADGPYEIECVLEKLEPDRVY